MDAVATCSGTATTLKRPRSPSSEDDCSKRPCYYYLLAPETTDYSSTDDAESVYSLQGHTTELAKDTSDTSDSMVEFEVVSLSEGDVYPLPENGSYSSSPSDVAELQDMPKIIFSNTESCDDSSMTVDKEKDCHKRLYLFTNCIKCGVENPHPHFRYCDKCFKVRKNFFPPRPKGKKKASRFKVGNKDVKLSGDSGIFLETSPTEVEVSSQQEVEESAQGRNLCNTCFVRPKNGAFIHKKIVHLFSCYQCSVKIIKKTGLCPICKVRVMKVCKVVSC